MLRVTTRASLVVALFASMTISSCGEDKKAAECSEGEEGCACYPNKTCNGELTCLSKLCVDVNGGSNEDKDASGSHPQAGDGSSGPSDGVDGSTGGGPGDPTNDASMPGNTSHPAGSSTADEPDPDNTVDPMSSSVVEPPDPSETPVGMHGQLHVLGSQLTDEHDNPVQLKGVSTMWLNWDDAGYSQSLEGLEYMRDHWGLQVIRAAMGVDADGAYLEDAATMKQMLTRVVDNAIEAGVYVIIDWHDHEAHLHSSEAQAFFSEFAEKYADVPNVLYETFNEPQEVSWSSTVKPYHEAIVATIREKDPDNVIILGTPNWSQRVDQAAADPVSGDNLMYTVHFYACSHGSYERGFAQDAFANGLPLFVTEWGAADADGGVDGVVCQSEAETWLDWLDANKISWAAWKLDGCTDSTCFFKDRTVSANGGWDAADLNGHAEFVISRMLENDNPEPVTTDTPMPTTAPTAAPPDDCIPTGTCADGNGMDCVGGELVARNCDACAVLSCGVACCGAIGSLGASTYPTFVENSAIVSQFSNTTSGASLEATFSGSNEMAALTFALNEERSINLSSLSISLAYSYANISATLENGVSGCQVLLGTLGDGIYSYYETYGCWGDWELTGIGSVKQINVRIDSSSYVDASLSVSSISWTE